MGRINVKLRNAYGDRLAAAPRQPAIPKEQREVMESPVAQYRYTELLRQLEEAQYEQPPE